MTGKPIFIQCGCWEEIPDLPTRVPKPSPTLDKNLASMPYHLWVREFNPVLGLGPGGTLLRHFQTPTLHWIHVSLRMTPRRDAPTVYWQAIVARHLVVL